MFWLPLLNQVLTKCLIFDSKSEISTNAVCNNILFNWKVIQSWIIFESCEFIRSSQIPSVSWIFHHSVYFRIYQIVSFSPGILCPLYCYYEWWGGWDRWGVVASYQGLGGGTGGGYYLLVCFLCLFLFVLLSFGLWCPASFLSE